MQLSAHSIQALFQQALALHERGDSAAACAKYAEVLQRQPDHAESLHLMGVCQFQCGDPEKALELIEHALNIDSALVLAYNSCGVVLQELGRLQEALERYNKALMINHEFAEVHNNRGTALAALGRLEAAISSYDRALSIQPEYAAAYNNRGFAFHKLHLYEAALADYDAALTIAPDYAEAYGNQGVTLYAQRRLEEALVSYNKALALKEDYAEAYWNKSLLLLLRGEYQEGWRLYEWRIKNPELRHNYYVFDKPTWRGEKTIKDKRLFIPAEQGAGDTIQFCRCLPLLKPWGASLIVEVPKELVALVTSLNCSMRVIPAGSELPDFDAYCPLMSLPYVFGTGVKTVPDHVPYLSAEPDKLRRWHEKLGAKKMLRVGLAWSGAQAQNDDVFRSMPLTALKPLLDFPFEWHSLQKEYRGSDSIELARCRQIHQHQADLHDYSDTAALIECMDIVISVDTSVAHLAGALNKPVCILLSGTADYRWMLDRDDTPWYPSAMLFRQTRQGDWSNVLEALVEFLTQRWQR